jgi:hypothetical protein
MRDSSSSERVQAKPMPSDDIIEVFDNLVEWWEKSEKTRYNLEGFERTNREPPPPENPIMTITALITYNQQRWEYEERLEDLRQQYDGRKAKFAEVAETVKYLLPEGYSVQHTYGGGERELRGRNYTVSHLPGEQQRASRGIGPSGEITVQAGIAPESS